MRVSSKSAKFLVPALLSFAAACGRTPAGVFLPAEDGGPDLDGGQDGGVVVDGGGDGGQTDGTTGEITVVVSPARTTVVAGGAGRFTATVTGTTQTAVQWSVRGGAANGRIEQTGFYFAPERVPPQLPVIVEARLAADRRFFGTAEVTLVSQGAGPPARITGLSGTGQTGTVALPLAEPLVVKVTDIDGNPASGVLVAFSSPSGGALDPESTATGPDGLASATATLGPTPGPQTFLAAAPGLSGSPVTFGATALPASGALLSKVSGDGQSGTVGTALAGRLTVRATDRDGNPVPGIAVFFAAQQVGAQVEGQATTGADGTASAAATLGTSAGTQIFTASAPGLDGSPQTFTATAVAGPAASLRLVSGNRQSGVAGAALAEPLTVEVLDAYGNPVSGVQVVFTARDGGGSVAPASAATGMDGRAQAAATLGPQPGVNRFEAKAAGLPAALFEATAVAGAATQLVKISGDNQSGTYGGMLGAPFVVEARDAQGRPVAGAAVSWTSLTQPSTVAPAETVTGADGRAQATGTLGQTGENRFQASATFGTPALFTAQAVAPTALTLEIVSGNNQQDIVDRVLAQALVVRVRGSGVPGVGGVTVTFAAVTGGGNVSPSSATTASDGTAQTTARLGRSAGAQRYSASVAGAANSPVFFDATGLPGPAAKLAAISGDGQRGVVGTALAQPFVLETRDAFDNAAGGVLLSFASLDGGAVSPAQAVTGAGGANGRAQATGTLGPRAGASRFTASAANLAGSPQTFVATALAGFAQTLEKVSGDNQSATVGTALGAPLVLRVRDGGGNPVPDVQVSFRADPNGSAIAPTTALTDANGIALASATLGTAAGAYAFVATAPVATGSPQTFAATGVAGPAANLAIGSGDGQAAPAGTALPQPLRARVTDRYGNPVTGTAVGFAVASGGGSLAPASAPSGADGTAATTATLGPLAGPNVFTASVPGLSGSPLAFNATATHAVTDVQVSPFSVTLAKGVARPFIATAIYSDRTTENVTAQATWSSSAPSVATVAGGLVTAVARGSATISAAFAGKTGLSSVTVTEPRLIRIEVTPANATVPVGAMRPYQATGVFDDGSTQPLTASAAWSSSNAGVLAVSDAAATKGQATGVASGSAEVRAAFGGLVGAASARVTGGLVSQVEIVPPGPSTQLGVQRQLRAVATYDDASILDVTALSTWASLDTSVATISSSSPTQGLVTPVAEGTSEITATYQSVTGRTQFIVEAATLVQIVVLPPQQQVPAGLDQPFQAFGVYSDGTSQNITALAAWSSSDPAVAVVSNAPAGIATGVAPGMAIITASRGNVSGSANLRVTDAQLRELRLQPDQAVAPPNVVLTFRAIGDFTNRSNEDVTPLAVWSTVNAQVATASNAPGQKGRVSTWTAGVTEVRAQFGGMAATARLQVAAATLTAITVTPAAPTVGVNETVRFFATGTFLVQGRSAQFDITDFATWFSSNPGIATVSNVAKGLATGMNPGAVTVTAAFNGVSGTTSLTVKPVVLETLVVSPANPVAPLQQRRLQFFATGLYADGSRSDLTQEAEWSTSDPRVAVFPLEAGQEGNAFFIERGSCTVTARVGTIRAQTTLTVR